nr:MAG TPA: hypothetical protein [Caudoviricetes sp.]
MTNSLKSCKMVARRNVNRRCFVWTFALIRFLPRRS